MMFLWAELAWEGVDGLGMVGLGFQGLGLVNFIFIFFPFSFSYSFSCIVIIIFYFSVKKMGIIRDNITLVLIDILNENHAIKLKSSG